MKTSRIKILANRITVIGYCLLVIVFAACSSDDDRIPNVTSATCPSAIEMQLPAEMQKLIYTDNTGADVLPLIVGESV